MASYVSTSVPPEFGIFSRLMMKQFVGTERPWLNLYGKRVRPVTPFGSVSSRPFNDPALIHRSLPDELLFEIFARADPTVWGGERVFVASGDILFTILVYGEVHA